MRRRSMVERLEDLVIGAFAWIVVGCLELWHRLVGEFDQ